MSYAAQTTPLNGREWISRLGKTMLVSPLLNMAWLNMAMISMPCGGSKSNNSGPPPLSNDQFLDEIERAIFLYFSEQASLTTGQIKDRALARGNDTRTVSSIAPTGFGLTALCIAEQRSYTGALGHLLRAYDAVSAGDRRHGEPDPRERVASIYASVADLPGVDLHYEHWRAAFHPPVLPRLVRLSQQAGRLRQLLQQLHNCYPSPPAILLVARQSAFRLFEQPVGNHGVGLGERLCGMGRAPADGGN